MNTKILIVATGLVLLLSGCSDEETHKYTEVTAFNFIQGPEKSVVVSFGENPQNHYSFAIKKKYIKTGTELFSESKNNTNFAVFADINEETLMRAANSPTSARVKVISVDTQDQKAVFEVEATLLNLDAGELKKLERVEVIFRGDDFLLLI
ncbi:hypothetical protein [Pseudoalteromonas sp. ZZD1]|uniref:hypothetical protein n=1 Tax=Pseudoalteromonas sp. ZZD1 TaxID=3139395 RepID=UPI003BAC88C5